VAAPLFEQRLVLVTGKGGVGKTVVSAAVARTAHEAGKRVLVGEIAPDLHVPSPLLALFGQPRPKGDEPVELAPRLYGVRLSASIGHKLFLRAALKVRLLVDTAMKSAALTRFLMAAPTFPEIGILYQMVALLREGFDQFVLDLPATGHAVGLTALPRTVHRVVPTGLIGDAIAEGLSTLTNPAKTAALIVTLPEALPVTECAELIATFQKHEIHVSAAILNQVPDDPFDMDERAAIRKWISARRRSILGSRELRRLERSLEAQASFRELIPASIPRVELPMIATEDQRAIVAELGKALKSERGGQR
jgi:arsenite/tail-anchored protein-transporting ATPase